MFLKVFSNVRKCPSGPTIRNSFLMSSRFTSNESGVKVDEIHEIETNLFNNSNVKRPIHIINPKQTQPKSTKSSVAKSFIKSEAIRNLQQKRERKVKLIDDPELGLSFFRGSEQLNPLLIAIRSQKQTDGSRKIVIEGRRLILEALSRNLCLSALFFSQRDQLDAIKGEVAQAQKAFGTKIYKISNHELKTWSALTTPPGLLAIFERPTELRIKEQNELSSTRRFPITVVCDNIREPNNLGSIIRTCAAIPCEQVIVTKGCCDPWESKALRGGCGGHFHITIRDDVSWNELHTHIPRNEGSMYRVFIAENNLKRISADNSRKAHSYNDLGSLEAHNIVIIGGESHGVSDDAYKFLGSNKNGRCIYIPLADGMDSLNVTSALTLILFEFRNQIEKLNSNKKAEEEK